MNSLFPLCDSMKNPLCIVVITGRNGDGKTTLLKELNDEFGYPYFNYYNRMDRFHLNPSFHKYESRTLPEQRVLLFDEVDWGMDALQQRSLYHHSCRFATENNLQIVMTTHSPEIRQVAVEDNVLRDIGDMWEMWNAYITAKK